MSDEREPQNGGELGASERKQKDTQKSTKERVKKGVDTAKKLIKKGAGKSSLLAALAPILMGIFVAIIILIIIIGLVMFFITMPGMVMDQLKALGKAISDAFANFFGEDSTTDVENTSMYETLDYLEQMGYDLKGYGFLTDYLSDESQLDSDAKEDNGVNVDTTVGVIRDDDDKIISAKTDYIYTYLVSDNYLYTIKNQNHTAGDGSGGFWNGLLGLGQNLLSFLTGGQLSQYWTRGFIAIYVDPGTISDTGVFYKDHPILTGDKITLDPSAKTLEIKRGHGNNSITYKLDGWVGRYGMPVDFLMAVHLATLMPDLAYDMASTFDTQLTLMLHPVGGGKKDENTAIGYYKVGDKYHSYDEFYDAAASGITGFLNSWRVSAKEAMNIMKEFGMESPETCLGTDGVGTDEIASGNDTIKFTEGVFSNRLSGSDLTSKQNEVVTKYNDMMSVMTSHGYDADDLPHSISSFSSFLGLMENLPRNENTSDSGFGYSSSTTYTYKEDSKGLNISFSWPANDNADYAFYTAEVTLGYNNYDYSSFTAAGGTPANYSEVRYNGSVKYTITGDWSEEKIAKYLEENDIDTTADARCSHNESETECCSACRSHIQKIYDYIKDVDVSNLEIYQPYIAKVTDHWYRDIYFVSKKDKEFITYDYEYEAMMKERWTLYETNDEGEFVYYTMNSDGKPDRVATQEEIDNPDIPVIKKAETVKINDEAEDLGWKDVAGNKLAAYEVTNETKEDFQQAYPDVAEDDKDYEIKKDVYVNIVTTGNVVQTGEGQREETTEEIKKMFLDNYYLRYDGTVKTAEIVTALRNAIYGEPSDDVKRYGPLDKSLLDKEYDLDFSDAKYTSEVESGKYKLSDYSGKVSLNQDSLNAFSMLENTHTLDADYIYRDFKELIVELGYFTKEELTDETPKLLQWIVPDIGSGGFPRRSIDKKEQEYGTQVHSKKDIDAYTKNTLKKLLSEMAEETTSGNNEFALEPTKGIGVKMGTGSNISISEVGSIDGETRSVSSVSIDEFLESTREMCEYINEEGYDYCVGVTCDGDGDQNCHHDAHGNDTCKVSGHTGPTCVLPKTFEASQEDITKHNVCCATLVSWALQNVKVMPDSEHRDGASSLADWIINNLDPQMIEVGQPLKPGDILCYDGHIDLVGEEIDGGFVKYNGGAYVQVGAEEFGDNSCIQKITGWPNDSRIKFALRLNWGGKKEGANYEGYEGNEAVVSPVTGILLEYNTYTETDKDSITNEEYRVNVDLKHGINNPSVIVKDGETENPEQPAANLEQPAANPESDTGTKNQEIVHDKVGYAKILVLDAENYQLLESNTSNRWQNDSLVKIKAAAPTKSESGVSYDTNKAKVNFLEGLSKEEQMDKDHENWNNLDKTVYGYKEFVEAYEKYGIAGNIVYIDGFVCELPQEDIDLGSEDDKKSISEVIPDGEDLNIDSFKKITENDLMSSDAPEKDKVMPTKYEADDEYKLASKKATDKLNAESSVKNQANSTISINEVEYPFIKEGTVIGRTMTDKELIEKVRKEKDKPYDYYRPEDDAVDSDNQKVDKADKEDKEDNNDKVMGNYIRVIMRDLDDTVVENVEEYMKLDAEVESRESFSEMSEEFMYWQAEQWEGFPNKWNAYNKYRRPNPSDSYGYDFQIMDDTGKATNLMPGLALKTIGTNDIGYGGGEALSQLGYTPDQMDIGDWVPGEDNIDAYYIVLKSELETVKSNVDVSSLDQYQVEALVEVAHAGAGYETPLFEGVKAGNVTEDTFQDTIRGTPYEKSGHNSYRRTGDWKLFSEALYSNGGKGGTMQHLEFSSDTPFQDKVRDINSGSWVND